MTDDDQPRPDPVAAAFDGAEGIEDEAPPAGGASGAEGGPDRGGPETAIDWDAIADNARQPQTDIGNARRFLRLHGQDATYIFGLGWFIYDGRRWRQDVSGHLARLFAHRTAESIAFEARFIRPGDDEQMILQAGDEAGEAARPLRARRSTLSDDEKLVLADLEARIKEADKVRASIDGLKDGRRKYARSSQNSAKISNMLTEAAVYRDREIGDMDGDPLPFNVLNGTLRPVRAEPGAPWSMRLDPHNREDLITKLCRVAYDEEAQAPLFETFLERIIPDADIRGFVKRFFGYTLTGLITEQVFVFFYGEGSNGKSTLVDIVARVLNDYAMSVPFATLAGDDRRRGDAATPDLVRIPGARMVRSSEPEENMRFKEAEVKAMTGGEPILIRRMREEFVEVVPEFKLILSGNHKPDIRGGDYGIWRRVLIVPFEQQIPKDEVDKQLGTKLWAERAGILTWLVQGLLEYLEMGLAPPAAVLAATSEHQAEQDPIGAFAADALRVTPISGDMRDDWVTNRALYRAYEGWCERNAVRAFSQKMFTTRFRTKGEKMGARPGKREGVRGWVGLAIDEAFADVDGGHAGRGPDDDIPFD